MELVLDAPTDKQKLFLLARTRYVAFGGSRGGGKSFAVRLKIKLLALKYAGIRMLLVRHTFPELRENHIRPLIKETQDIATYRDTDKTLTFANGSFLKFGYCDSENDVDQYQGQEYDVIFIDEATQFSEYVYDCIKACNRGTNEFPKRIYLTCNPGGQGHSWVKRLFIDKDYRDGENPNDYTFIRSSVYDNAPLLKADPEYLKNLESLPEDLKKAWLYGDWEMFAGQYFTEFRRNVHVVKPFDIPYNWNRVIAMDYGLDMLAVLWCAFDENGTGYVYKELCQSGLRASDAASRIIDMCDDNERGLHVIAPPDLWSRQKDTGKSIFELFRDSGINFQKADNNRVAGWINIKEWLAIKKDSEGLTTSKLYFFDTCKEIIHCLPLLQYSATNSMDCATEPHNITHAPDALRYLIQSRPKSGAVIDTRTDMEKFLQYTKTRRFKKINKSKVIR